MTGALLILVIFGGGAAVVWLARSVGAEGARTGLDAPWSRFCELRGLELEPARRLVGEQWPMITGAVGDLRVAVDVFEEQFGQRRVPCTRLRVTAAAQRLASLRVASRVDAAASLGRVIRTGDSEFDRQLVAFAERDDDARLLGDEARAALLEVAGRARVQASVSDDEVTVLVLRVLSESDDLSAALDAALALATTRSPRAYR